MLLGFEEFWPNQNLQKVNTPAEVDALHVSAGVSTVFRTAEKVRSRPFASLQGERCSELRWI